MHDKASRHQLNLFFGTKENALPLPDNFSGIVDSWPDSHVKRYMTLYYYRLKQKKSSLLYTLFVYVLSGIIHPSKVSSFHIIFDIETKIILKAK